MMKGESSIFVSFRVASAESGHMDHVLNQVNWQWLPEILS